VIAISNFEIGIYIYRLEKSMSPEKINVELIKSLCEDIAQGFSYERAALNSGIAASTFFR
jgi:hypothetical protein